jgi:predicted nucleotidyltransferase
VDEEKKTELLGVITQRILAVSHPERIILFGSQARDDTGLDSDFDLLVVKHEVDSIRAEEARIYRAISDLLVAVDVVVVRRSFLERHGDLVGTVVRSALRDGQVLYAA